MGDMMDPILLNFMYAALGGCMTLFFGWLAAFLFRRRMDLDSSEELKKGNTAVAIVICGIFIGTGISMGLVIGLSLN